MIYLIAAIILFSIGMGFIIKKLQEAVNEQKKRNEEMSELLVGEVVKAEVGLRQTILTYRNGRRISFNNSDGVYVREEPK